LVIGGTPLNHELLEMLIKNFDESPMVMAMADGSVTWYNEAFKRAFPVFEKSARRLLTQELEFLYDDSSSAILGRFTSRTFKCIRLSSRNKALVEGISITDQKETLYRFKPNLISGDEIIEKISVVNMELASVSRELSRKNREIEESNKRINQLLRTDFLTGCGNRRYFTERLEEFCSRYTRDNNKKFCVIFADLNKFKHINDTYGHDMGDVALKMFSDSIRKIIRLEDVFARIGGDEFAMIIECSGERDCRRFIDKLRVASSSIRLPGTEHQLSSSFGYVVSEGTVDAQGLMKEADEYLYIDKNKIIS